MTPGLVHGGKGCTFLGFGSKKTLGRAVPAPIFRVTFIRTAESIVLAAALRTTKLQNETLGGWKEVGKG